MSANTIVQLSLDSQERTDEYVERLCLNLNPPVRDGALNRECPPDQVKWYLLRVHFDQSEEHLVDAI